MLIVPFSVLLMRKGKLKEGGKITLHGYLEGARDFGGLVFIIFRDNDGQLQITLNKQLVGEKLANEMLAAPRESVVRIDGKVKLEPRAPNGVEIVPLKFKLISASALGLPIDINGKNITNMELRLDWRVLDLRNRKNKKIFYIESDFERYAREYFYKKGLVEIHTPKLIGTPSESGSELFSLEYFGKTAYLAQSPQFYKQMAMAAGFEKIFEIGPVFRAEPSFTTRHVTEITMLDFEMAYIKSVEDVMKFEEKWLVYVFSKLKKKWGDDIKKDFGVEVVVPKTPFPRITMKEAHEILKGKGRVLSEGQDITSTDEVLLYEHVKEKFGHEFVFVTQYPWAVRPFYHMRNRKDKSKTMSYDLLYRGMEITTGAQREHRYEVLLEQAKEKGLDPAKIDFYLNFFKYGVPPHGGFGFGITRLVKQLLNLENIRETTFIPRDPNRLNP